MSSTLPRTKSLGGADTRSLTRDYKNKNQDRPSSLCEAAVHRVGPVKPSALPDRMKRTPSQANSLSTTVPTSIVSQTLGGRHAPTRSSLRHSRMVLLNRNARGGAGGGGGIPCRRKPTYRFLCIISFVIFSFIFVGVVDILLAVFLMHWAPSLLFWEVPHYPGAIIVASGILSAVVFKLKPDFNHNGQKIFKVLVIIFLIASTLSSVCVCVFNVIHLIDLAPQECGMKKNVVAFTTPSPLLLLTSGRSLIRTSPLEDNYPLENSNTSLGIEGTPGGINNSEDITTSTINNNLVLSEDHHIQISGNDRENKSSNSSVSHAQIDNKTSQANINVCICYDRHANWKISKIYSKLICEEVKNILPIFLVASCVLMMAGIVMSSVIIYLLRTYSRLTNHNIRNHLIKPEAKPFLYNSKLKNSDLHLLKHRNTSNGSYLYR